MINIDMNILRLRAYFYPRERYCIGDGGIVNGNNKRNIIQ